MATIYGTPVILWKVPDTSEQWRINSTVADHNITVNEKTNFVSNNEGELYKIELDLSSYGKYKNICKEKFNIVLNYSDFGEVSEIVNPID